MTSVARLCSICITRLLKQASRFIFGLIEDIISLIEGIGIICELVLFGCCTSISYYL